MTSQKLQSLKNRVLFSKSFPLFYRFLPKKSLCRYLVTHRRAFENFVYTPLEEAHEELKKRWEMNIAEPEYVPEVMRSGFRSVMFRQLVTPNYEIVRFINLHDERLKPLFFEYFEDKFSTQSYEKHALGRPHFFHGIGKKGGAKIDKLKVIDFNASDGKKISEVKTLWGQPLVDFHKEVFLYWNKKNRDVEFFEASKWFMENGQTPVKYYERFMTLFLRHGILFENFVLEFRKERDFTENVFLPAFIKTWKNTGLRPLIVSLAPTNIEGDKFWLCHEGKVKNFVEKKLTQAA